jgi:hypothetical protein
LVGQDNFPEKWSNKVISVGRQFTEKEPRNVYVYVNLGRRLTAKFTIFSRFVRSFPFFLHKQCTAQLVIECDLRFGIARFGPKGEIREIFPLAVRADILPFRPNFPSAVNLSQKYLHHGIRRIASWDMFTFLTVTHVLTYSAPRGPRAACY